MEIHGFVHNGVVVLTGGVSLPEGTPVTVSCQPEPATPLREKRRVQLPLVRTGAPGSMNLTNERIAEIFNAEDIASARC